MTADVELPPLPEYLRRDYASMSVERLEDSVQIYARANVEAATKHYRDMLCQSQDDVMKLSGETEALRTELSQVREAYQRRTRDMYAREDSIMALRAEVAKLECANIAYSQQTALLIGRAGNAEARAERLAEALQGIADLCETEGDQLGNARSIARAALRPTAAQENDDA